MGLPILVKTWQFSVNNTVATNASANVVAAGVMLEIKNLMKGFGTNPWVVRYSSNAGGSGGSPTGAAGTVGDGVDRWSTSSDVFSNSANNPAGRHAWMVMRQTGIATNFEVLFDMSSTGTISSMQLIVSPSVGFSGGSVTTRPSASDEMYIITGNESSNTAFPWSSNTTSQCQVHAMQSTDGQCTRVIVWNSGTVMGTYWLFDKPQNTISGWTNPSISSAYTGTSGVPSYANLSATTAAPVAAGSSTSINNTSQGLITTPTALAYTGEGDSSGLLANATTISANANSFDGYWPMCPIGIYGITAPNRGRHGNLFDIWWNPSGIASGTTIPNDATKQFVCFGPLIFPWDGASTPLLT